MQDLVSSQISLVSVSHNVTFSRDFFGTCPHKGVVLFISLLLIAVVLRDVFWCMNKNKCLCEPVQAAERACI